MLFYVFGVLDVLEMFGNKSTNNEVTIQHSINVLTLFNEAIPANDVRCFMFNRVPSFLYTLVLSNSLNVQYCGREIL